MHFVQDLVKVCFVFCIAIQLVSSADNETTTEVPTAYKSKNHVLEEPNNVPIQSQQNAYQSIHIHKPTVSHGPSAPTKETIAYFINHLLPPGEIGLLKVFNGFLAELIKEQQKICEKSDNGEIPPPPFFNCTVFKSGKPKQPIEYDYSSSAFYDDEDK